MNKCMGCGINLETDYSNNLCERCFRIRNYNDYKLINADNNKFLEILKSINKTGDLTILVIDLFNFSSLDIIKKYLTNDLIIVLTKKDILPKKISDQKLIAYFKKNNMNFKDIIVISSIKNYNFDLLHETIKKYQHSKNVYVVGFTNAGKSTMINKIIYNYSNNNTIITTSVLPSTTLDSIEIDISDSLTLIDTPGILTENSLYNQVTGKELKKIIPRKEIKPISYQVKGKQYIIIDKYCMVEAENIDLIIFMSNCLSIKRIYKNNMKMPYEQELHVKDNDVVIEGLGFIKIRGQGKLKISLNNNVAIYTRESLV